MNFEFRIAAVMFVVLSTHAGAPFSSAQSPHWVWPRGEQSTGTRAVLRREFTSPAAIQSAHLAVVADFCDVTVQLNGKEVGMAEGYSAPVSFDVTDQIFDGLNRLEIRATAMSGPSAVACRLELSRLDGTKTLVVTDKSWSSAWSQEGSRDESPTSVDLGELREFELDPQRQFDIAQTDDYEQWKRALQMGTGTAPASFKVADGFEISLVHSARPEEGSWISMAFDPRGRLIIGREDRGLLRVTLANDASSATKVETVEDSLLECRGLLFAYDSLYVNANNSKGLYRLRDTRGDDRFDEVKLLRRFEGSVGHGRNDLTLGPDGKIYLIHGDSVELPRDARDWTSPFREHRRGQKIDEGHLLRTDRDGREWEIVSAGLRNPYGIAFHADGEAFTYDADAEFDMGAPWYRPTQVKHLVAGADFGWRGVTGKWPPYYPDHPDNALPSVHIGKGSPTSVKFGYTSRFPQPYRDALYVLDWAYGRIIAVHLAPRGASYTGVAENFLQGRPLNVTDLDFGPDGAMYFVTGGRKTQSGLYRVRFIGTQPAPRAPTNQQIARQQHAVEARQLRRQLELLLDSAANEAAKEIVDKAWLHLGQPDPSIRYAARTAIERVPLTLWQDRALAEPQKTARLTALLALARSGDPTLLSRVLEQLNQFSLGDLTTSQKSVVLFTYQLCLTDLEQRVKSAVAQAVTKLEGVYPDRSAEINHSLSFLLAKLNSPQTVSKTVGLLTNSRDQAEQLHYLFVLRNVQDGWSSDLRHAYATAFQRSSSYLGGQGMPGFLKQIRDEVLASAPKPEREAVAAALESVEKDEPLPQRPFVQSWKIAEFNEILSGPLSGRSDSNGSRLFREALCARCHRVGSLGQLIGPDLTDVSRRFSHRDILQSILEPSLVVAENYRNDRIETSNGLVLVGRIVASGDYRSSNLRIATDPLRPSQTTEVPKQNIVSHTTILSSPMPAGLFDTLTKDEILDLVAFIVNSRR